MKKFKKYKWRLYADNNIAREIVDYLRKFNMDVLWVAENSEFVRQKEDSFHYQKASQFGRYLLTNDVDFRDDRNFPLKDCPSLVLLTTGDQSLARHLPVLLRRLFNDYNPLPELLYLTGIKIEIGWEGIIIRLIDRDCQKVSTESWAWSETI